VRVNAGGDPDRDDFGLPPIDIVIPDDARELDRDMQAYQRELRALRRRRRVSRLYGPLARDGMALPLLAGCLMLALLTSTLLIMFAADQTGMPQLPRATATGHYSPRRTPTAAEPAAGHIGGPLPAADVVIGGKTVALRELTTAMPSVLALVPPDCNCASTLRQLNTQAAQAHVLVYLVSTSGDMKQLTDLASASGQANARVADDTGNVLGPMYGQKGVTAIIVSANGTVASVVRQLPQQQQMQTGLQQITTAKAAGH
jgi:hypothetical protein